MEVAVEVVLMGATGITGTTKSGVGILAPDNDGEVWLFMAPEKVGEVWVAVVKFSWGNRTM